MKIAFLDQKGMLGERGELLSGAALGMRHLSQLGFEIAVLNQRRKPLDAGADHLAEALRNAGIRTLGFYGGDGGRSALRLALDDYSDMDKARSFVCGESEQEMREAHEAGLKFYSIGAGKHNRISSYSDLCGILDFIE